MSHVRITLRDRSIECAQQDLKQLIDGLTRAMEGLSTNERTTESGVLRLAVQPAAGTLRFSGAPRLAEF